MKTHSYKLPLFGQTYMHPKRVKSVRIFNFKYVEVGVFIFTQIDLFKHNTFKIIHCNSWTSVFNQTSQLQLSIIFLSFFFFVSLWLNYGTIKTFKWRTLGNSYKFSKCLEIFMCNYNYMLLRLFLIIMCVLSATAFLKIIAK